MFKFLSRLLLATLFIFVFAVLAQAAAPAPKAANLAIDFKLQDSENNTISLSDYKGKQPVILFFWTTWCPYCRKEIKEIENAYSQLTKDGWVVLNIDVGEPAYKVENFIRANDIKLKVLLDKDTQVASDYEILGVPTFIIINKEGSIIFRDNFFPQGRLKELITK